MVDSLTEAVAIDAGLATEPSPVSGARAPVPEVLPTSVVGSDSVPDWLGRFKTDVHRGRLSAGGLREIEEVAVKAAVVDQTLAGLDIISDGELGRDNDIDYLVPVIGGIDVDGEKELYFDYLDAVVRRPLAKDSPIDPSALVEDFRLVRGLTDKVITVSVAGPYSLSKRLRNEAYDDETALVFAVADSLQRVCRALVDAGVTHVQLDEPYLAGYPEMAECAIRAINTVATGLDAHVALHVCYGNRYARPAWEGHYDFLFPLVCEARIDELVLEFARKGYDDLDLLRRYPAPFQVGVGVIDVKSREVETVAQIEQRLQAALRVLPPERIVVNPDCGLRHLPAHIAARKLSAMCEAADNVRATLLGR